MNTLATSERPRALSARCDDAALHVALADGRELSVPLAWFPRLLHATAEHRERFELLGDGEGLHWPTLDEDLSVAGLLAGRSSLEAHLPHAA